MLTIRLQRTGRKHEPTFRVVLTESKNGPKSGKYLEVLGAYDPRKSNESLKADRIKYWISQGAQTSDTVHNLLINQQVIEGKKINVLPKKTPPPVKAEATPTEAGEAKAETTNASPDVPSAEGPAEPEIKPAEEKLTETELESAAVEETKAEESSVKE